VAIQRCFAIFGAKDNVNDDLTKRLRHCGIIAEKDAEVNRAFSASEFLLKILGRCPRLVLISRRRR
jgi:hypothetical protein